MKLHRSILTVVYAWACVGYSATLTLTPITSYPGMIDPHSMSASIRGDETFRRNEAVSDGTRVLNVHTVVPGSPGSLLCQSNGAPGSNGRDYCRPRLVKDYNCNGGSLESRRRTFLELNGGVIDLRTAVPTGTGWWWCGPLVMDVTVVTGPALPEVSCTMVGDTVIELAGETGGVVPSARVVIGVSCTGRADFRVTVPRGGTVPITSGDTVHLSFDDGSVSVLFEQSSGASVGLNARIDQRFDYAGAYYGSSEITLDVL